MVAFASTTETVDIMVRNEVTIWVFTPMTQRMKDWVEEHVEVPDWGRWGSGFVCDHRMAHHLAEGIKEQGFALEFA